jgi:hypothetical protein
MIKPINPFENLVPLDYEAVRDEWWMKYRDPSASVGANELSWKQYKYKRNIVYDSVTDELYYAP